MRSRIAPQALEIALQSDMLTEKKKKEARM